MYRIGLIGMGMIGQRHIDTIIKSGHKLAGVSASSARSSNIYAELYDTQPFETWQDMVKSKNIDIIINNTPNHLHLDVNMAALAAKKPIYTEKPLGRSVKETTQMFEMAKKRKLPNGVNYNRRGFPAIQRIKSMIESGDLGDILMVRGNYLQDWLLKPETWNWRVDPAHHEQSRALPDIGAHLIDLALYTTGLVPKEIFYEMKTLIPKRKNPQGKWVKIQNEDIGNLLVRFTSGAQGIFTFCQTAAGHRGSDLFIEISGSKMGVVWYENNEEQIIIKHYMDEDEIIEVEPAKYNFHGQFEVFMDFLKWVEGNKPAAVASFADGHRQVYLMERALKSYQTQKWVKWTLK